jgi:hypothetical protein
VKRQLRSWPATLLTKFLCFSSCFASGIQEQNKQIILFYFLIIYISTPKDPSFDNALKEGHQLNPQ